MSNEIIKSVQIQVDSDFLRLVVEVESDFSKVVSEALHLWAKEKVLTCPINNEFCINIQGQCNKCERFQTNNISFS